MHEERAGLPRSESAESAVLGIFLAHGTLVGASKLDVADFYSERHRAIFQAMRSLSSEGQRVDIVMVEERLRRDRELGIAGGGVYLMELTQDTVSSIGWDSYESIIWEKAIRRRAIAAARKLNDESFEDSLPIAQVVGNFSAAAGQLASSSTSGVTSFQTVLSKILSNPVSTDQARVKTGLVFLDNALKILQASSGSSPAAQARGRRRWLRRSGRSSQRKASSSSTPWRWERTS